MGLGLMPSKRQRWRGASILRHICGMRAVAPALATPTLEGSGSLEAETVARVSRRLLPILFLLFVVAFVDRTNVGLAAAPVIRRALIRFSAGCSLPATIT